MKAAFALGVVLLSAGTLVADSAKGVSVRASGWIVERSLCGADLCQTAVVRGLGTRLGPFDATFSDRINLQNGSYTATGLVTTSDGSTLLTEAVGQSFPPDENGVVSFFEVHTIVGGTGQYAGASGEITVTGTATAEGRVEISGVGTLIK